MTDETTTPAAAPVPEKKPRKPRKPRAPKAEKPQVAAAPPPPTPIKPEKKPKHYVEQQGRTVTLCGTDVQLRAMTPEQLKAHGVKDMQGTMGTPCATPLVLTFKSPTAAEKFFDLCLHAEEEADAHIDCGNKTEWYSENLMGGFV